MVQIYQLKPKKSTYSLEEFKGKMEAYCAYQDRCHKEVEEKLRAYDLIPEAREMILLHLLEEGFLNEERFARSFARGKFRIKKWGRMRIERELRSRDISSYNIKQGLSEIDPDDYEQTLFELSEKKFQQTHEKHPLKKRKKVADFLLRRGFESQKVYAVLLELEKENKSK
jgi:regulatory protein